MNSQCIHTFDHLQHGQIVKPVGNILFIRCFAIYPLNAINGCAECLQNDMFFFCFQFLLCCVLQLPFIVIKAQDISRYRLRFRIFALFTLIHSIWQQNEHLIPTTHIYIYDKNFARRQKKAFFQTKNRCVVGECRNRRRWRWVDFLVCAWFAASKMNTYSPNPCRVM